MTDVVAVCCCGCVWDNGGGNGAGAFECEVGAVFVVAVVGGGLGGRTSGDESVGDIDTELVFELFLALLFETVSLEFVVVWGGGIVVTVVVVGWFCCFGGSFDWAIVLLALFIYDPTHDWSEPGNELHLIWSFVDWSACCCWFVQFDGSLYSNWQLDEADVGDGEQLLTNKIKIFLKWIF